MQNFIVPAVLILPDKHTNKEFNTNKYEKTPTPNGNIGFNDF